ncbi:lipid II:glycine glycyltransferase FemX [Pelagibacterium limicola]|uniref:lipid II:glycine glycyltransferase FemX n=1 Tax=Pelagibacterium limicola TaxID=2791022 RepID=UPI0018AFC2F7|nr:GNAT family N-acetyltransferase [Pelagibacterium limicola]
MDVASHSPAALGAVAGSKGGLSGSAAVPAGLVAKVLPGDVWDEVAVAFDGICQEQLYAYARGRWPGVALEPVLFSKDGETIGGALVMLQPLPLKLGMIALVKWGPMLADAGAPGGEEMLRGMIGHLKAEYGDRRAMMVSIMPPVESQRENAGLARLIDLGFSQGESLRAPDRYVVDVRLDDEKRMAAFSQKWRYHLRKAMKNELVFERSAAHNLERFMTLYDAMSERKRFADHSAIDTVSDLFALPEGRGRPELFFVSREGSVVAGAIVFTAGATATYLYGATIDAALDLRAGYFLHWHVLGWLRDHTRARWYDLGGTDGSPGLHQFKSGMVGDAGFIHPLPPIANYTSHRSARLAGEAAYMLRRGFNNVRDALDAYMRVLAKHLRRAAR